MSRSEKDVLDRVRAAMRAAGLDIKGLGAACGVPYQTMQSYLAGRRRLPGATIPAIARATDTCCDWLLTGEPLVPHPRSLMLAVYRLYQMVSTNRASRARTDDDAPALGEWMGMFYLTYKREYLGRFRDRTKLHISSAEHQADAAVLQRFYELGGPPGQP